ncbi:rRNA-processing protein fcf1 homolog [Phtheirospermum japonicum]|uniref:rRNA-processing protein fcf1 homolog n=1 Tax=Phtheirospermum japonicum TaxID=374723 RepID=A0A830C5U3_9LAMI|nr:rRNA-processing protein fcf1 homolog [Phtheirospermum japonicum]
MGKAKKAPKFAVMKKIVTRKALKHYKEEILNPNKKDLTKEKLAKNVPQVSSALYFNHNTALGPPYRVLVDTNFINFSIQNKLDLEKGMMDCLYAKCTPCITDCVMAELEKLGQKYRVALRHHKCYIVATCDRDLKRRIRKVPGVPIMYITQHRYSIERLPEATIGGGHTNLLPCDEAPYPDPIHQGFTADKLADILVNLTSPASEMGRLVSEGYVLAPGDETMAKLTADQLSNPGAPEQIIYYHLIPEYQTEESMYNAVRRFGTVKYDTPRLPHKMVTKEADGSVRSLNVEYDDEATDVEQQALLPSVRDPKLWMVKVIPDSLSWTNNSRITFLTKWHEVSDILEHGPTPGPPRPDCRSHGHT